MFIGSVSATDNNTLTDSNGDNLIYTNLNDNQINDNGNLENNNLIGANGNLKNSKQISANGNLENNTLISIDENQEENIDKAKGSGSANAIGASDKGELLGSEVICEGTTISNLSSTISRATAGDTVKLANDLTRTSSAPYISKSIIIDGDGHTIDATQGILFYFNNNALDITLQNINFINGSTADSPYIYSYKHGKLTFINCSFNTGFLRLNGYNDALVNLEMYNCTFTNNAGSGRYGGALQFQNPVDKIILEGCNFTNCSNGNGATVYINSGTSNPVLNSFTVNNCNFINCSAPYAALNYVNGNITNSNFINCTGENTIVQLWDGNISNCSFIGNNQTGGNLASVIGVLCLGNNNIIGSGIACAKNCTFINNTVKYSSLHAENGDNLTIINCTIENTTGSHDVSTYSGNVSIYNSTFNSESLSDHSISVYSGVRMYLENNTAKKGIINNGYIISEVKIKALDNQTINWTKNTSLRINGTIEDDNGNIIFLGSSRMGMYGSDKFIFNITNETGSSIFAVTINYNNMNSYYNSETGVFTFSYSFSNEGIFTVTPTYTPVSIFPNAVISPGVVVIEGERYNMSVTKTANSSVLDIGDNVSFDVNITNTGNRDLTNIKFTDNFPSAFEYISHNDTSWTYNSNTRVFTYTGDKLSAGESLVLNILFKAVNNGTYNNTVVVSSSEVSNINNRSGNIRIYRPNVTVTKVANVSSVDIGGNISFLINITNNGDKNLSNIRFVDNFPSAFQYISHNDTTWTYNAETKTFTYIGGALTPGSNLIIVVVFNASDYGSYNNTVIVYTNETSDVNASSANVTINRPSFMVTKVSNISVMDIGETVSFRVNITNNGSSTLSNISFIDNFPSAFQYVSHAGAGWSYNPDTRNFTYAIGNLTSGRSLVLDIVFKALNKGTYNNTVVVSSAEIANVSKSSNNVTIYGPNMTVSKKTNTTSMNIGENLSFTINITNNGDRNLSNISFVDNFPSAFQYVSHNDTTWTYNADTKVFTYTGNDLVPANSLVLNIVFKAVTNGTYNNTIVVSSTGLANLNASSENIRIYEFNMTVTKVANTSSMDIGENVKFTVNITNTGDKNLTNIVFVDNYPTAFQYLSHNDTSWTYNAETRTFAYNGDDLTPDKSLVLDIVFKALNNGTYNNTIVVSSSEIPGVSGESANIRIYRSNMTVTKVANRTSMDINENISFTVNITNNGDKNLSNINFVDNFPTAFQYLSHNDTTWTYNAETRTFAYNGNNLTSGNSLVLNIVFKAVINGTYNNTIVVSSTEISNVNASSDNVRIYKPNMAVSKVANASSIDINENISFTVNITDTGDRNLSNISFIDNYPFAFEYLSHNDTTWAYNAETKTFTYNGNDLVPEGSLVLNIVFKATNYGTYNNTIVVSSLGVSDLSASSDNIRIYSPNMTVSKVANTSSININETISFTVNITNNGDKNLTNISFIDNYPTALDYVSHNGSDWIYDANTKVFKYTGNDLVPGNSLVLNIVFKAVSNGTFNNTVVVSSPGISDVNASSNNIRVYSPNMTVSKVANTSSLDIGETISFTVNITNKGDKKLSNISFIDNYSTALDYISHNDSDWTYDANTKVFSYNGNDLVPGNSLILNIVFKAISNGTFNNVIVVSSPGVSNVSASSDNIRIYRSNMTVTKVSNASSMDIGETIRFIVEITNNGDKNLSNISFIDNFPSAFEYISHDSSLWTYDANTRVFTFTGNDLVPEGHLVLNIIFRAVNNGTYNNTIITSSSGISDVIAISSIVRIYRPNMTVSKTLNVTDVTIDTLVKYNITINNTGDRDLSEIFVRESDFDGFILVNYNEEDGWNNSTGIFKYNGVLDIGDSISLILVYNVTKEGNYTNVVNVSSNGISTVTRSSDELKVHNKTQSSVYGSDVNVTYGEDIIVNVTSINAKAVNYQIINENASVIANGSIGPNGSITGLELGVGNYTVKLTTVVDEGYLVTNATCKITVNLIPTIVIPSAEDIYVGDVAVIKIVVYPQDVINLQSNSKMLQAIVLGDYPVEDLKGTVNITVDGIRYNNVKLIDGVTQISVANLTAGLKNVFVSYSGDNNYLISSNLTTFNVLKLTPNMTIDSENIIVGEDETITVNLSDDATGNVTITVNGVNYTAPVVDGKVTFDIAGLKAGKYSITVSYSGDEKYSSTSSNGTFTVSKLSPNMTIGSENIIVGDNENIVISLPEDATGNVTITVNGVNYTAPVVDGKVTFDIAGLKAGKYSISASYSGDEKYSAISSKGSFTVSKSKASISVDSQNAVVGEDGIITVHLPKDATGTVTVTINGKTYTATVKNGKAVFKIPGLNIGKYNFKVSYSGDDKYGPINTTGVIEITPKKNNNTDVNNTTKKVDKKVKHGIDLNKNNTGNPIALILLSLLSLLVVPLRRK